MTLAALIRKSESVRFATATSATVATLEGDKVRTVATVATVSVANPPKTKTVLASRWWLVHYPDGAPVEVWTDPPATHAEVLQGRPDAVAAQPLHQDAMEPIAACSTCSRATYRGGCDEPVVAGLSAQDGVIRYHGNGGKDCPDWLAQSGGCRDKYARIREGGP